jgi:hypothetical protein
MFVKRLERATVDVPVQLLADQRQVDEFDERRLQLFAYRATALVRRGTWLAVIGPPGLR